MPSIDIGKSLTFQKGVLINTELKKIFDFHLDSNNLHLISPPFPKIKIIQLPDIPLKKNDEVELELNFFLFKIKWRLIIDEIDKNIQIVDKQIKGPFKEWRHTHFFHLEKEKVKMIDKIEFTPPFGLIGKIFAPIIYFKLWILFSIRHYKTKKYFEGN